MKLAQVIALAAAGGFLATDKKPEDLTAYLLAADKKGGGRDRARDEAEEAEDTYAEGIDSKAAAMDEAEEKEDAGKEDKGAKDRKSARDARKSARDARKGARDARRSARDKRAKDSNTDPEHTNDNELENAETGTPSKGGKSEPGGMDSAAVDARVNAAVAAERSRNEALREVEPILGTVAYDSANAAYKAALDKLGVDTNGVHESAYRSMLKMAKDARVAEQSAPSYALDQSSAAEIATRIPHLNRL